LEHEVEAAASVVGTAVDVVEAEAASEEEEIVVVAVDVVVAEVVEGDSSKGRPMPS
jgi:hypothetical protein